MRERRGWAAVLLAGVAGVAATGPMLWLTALPASAFTASVTINDKAKPDPNGAAVFNQPVTSIHVNDRIIWSNKTQNKHTVTSDPGAFSFDSGEIRPGGSYEIRFTTPGTYTYKCTIHPSMVGRIEVTDPSAPTTTTTAPAPPPAPPTTTTAPAPPPTTAPPAPPTTAAPTTSTGPSRPPAAAAPPPAPPVPTSAPAPPPLASSSTTTLPSTTTTTVPPTTVTSAPPVLAGGGEGAPPASGPATPPTTAAPPDTGGKAQTAAGPPHPTTGHVDATAVALVTALVAVGLFGIWTLIRVRPGAV